MLVYSLPLMVAALPGVANDFLDRLLFRFFDIAKPLGVRQMERFPGGIGVMADDILAGIYSLFIIICAQWIL